MTVKRKRWSLVSMSSPAEEAVDGAAAFTGGPIFKENLQESKASVDEQYMQRNY